MKISSNKALRDAGNAMKVQQHQRQQLANLSEKLLIDTLDLNKNVNKDSQALDEVEQSLTDTGHHPSADSLNNLGIDALAMLSMEVASDEITPTKEYELIDLVNVPNDFTWQEYQQNFERYAELNKIDLVTDPFRDLMSNAEAIEFQHDIQEDYGLNKKSHCDKYDYFLATFSGAICGLIDVFFVGGSKEEERGKLASWSDNQTDNLVIKFCWLVWKYDKAYGKLVKSKKKKPTLIASAIGYLEQRFKVPYDARYAKDLGAGGEEVRMTPLDHHLKSLAHSPDLIGLFFSILDQFRNTTSVVSDGKIKIIKNKTSKGNQFELRGGNFEEKLICGFVNWFGHLMSDIAGSSGTRGHGDKRRGAGIPAPFYSLTQLMDFGGVTTTNSGEKTQATIADIADKVYKNGYDARFAAAQAIPVAVNEFVTRFLWAVKRVFVKKIPTNRLITKKKSPELRRMLLVSYGTLCSVDGVDATAHAFIIGKSMHNPVFWYEFFSRANFVAWSRLGLQCYQEVIANFDVNAIDTVELNQQVDQEWKRLYQTMI